jgi:hypothetical protein
MVNDVQALRRDLVDSGIAEEKDLEGASVPEINELEEQYGKLPTAYREILQLIGKKAGRLIDDSEFRFYIDQLDVLNIKVHEYRNEAIEEGEKVADLPGNAFFISSRGFDNPCFILLGESEDSSVYIYRDEDEKIETLHDSIWDWLEEFIRDSKGLIDKGVEFRHVRLG